MKKRSKRHEEHENHERWLVSYADFITLLFAFFVVLYATSTQNEEKEKQFEQSVKINLSLGQAGSGAEKSMGGMFGDVIDPIESIQRRRQSNEDLEENINQLLSKSLTKDEKKETIAGLKHDITGVRIQLSSQTFFPSGSAKLRLPALKSLDKIANVLKLAQREVIIEGHTDDRAIVGGNFDSNWELASLRATSVVRYLLKYHQWDAQKISASSFADQRPLVANDTDENRNRNRRIEIVVLNKSLE